MTRAATAGKTHSAKPVDRTAGLRCRALPTPWGPMALVARGEALAGVLLPRPDGRQLTRDIQQRWPDTREDDAALPLLVRELADYFAGRPVAFTVPLDLSDLTEFQQRVLRACRRIRPGQTWSYARLAAAAGSPRAARAVGQAMARNPVPLVVPCHRVVAADGSLCGFSDSGGLDLKRRLLDHERRAAARP